MSNPIKPTNAGSSRATHFVGRQETDGSNALEKSKINPQLQEGAPVESGQGVQISPEVQKLADGVRAGEISSDEVLEKLVDQAVDVSIQQMVGEAQSKDLRTFLKNALDDDPVLLEMLQELDKAE